jgi:hypothetical protein
MKPEGIRSIFAAVSCCGRFLVAASIIFGAGNAVASEEADARPTKCSAAMSEKVSVAQVASNAEQYVGRCVSIDGVMQRWFLYENVDGVYLQEKEPLNPSSSGARLGLDNITRHFGERFRHVSILGRVQDCETVRDSVHAAAGENELVMISGYCHYENGAYLWVHKVGSRGGPPFERRMGSYGRPGYGDLEPATEAWPHRDFVENLAKVFVEALRSRDRDRLAGLHFRDVGLEWDEEESQLMRFLLDDRKSPFAAIRSRGTVPQHVILIERPAADPASTEPVDDEDRSNYTATVCFCREDDCTGRWPIARFDADNVNARPYACTQIGPYLIYREGEVPHFTTAMGSGGLAEPRRRGAQPPSD